MSTVRIYSEEKRFPVAPDLYGLFFEDISRAGDGGLYPELLRNRSFEDSLMPEGCVSKDGWKTFVSPTGWIEEFNNGEGMNSWVKDNSIPYTPVPAWYSRGAEMTLEQTDVLNPRRKAALRVRFAPGGEIFNTGYCGIPVREGKKYHFYMFAKVPEKGEDAKNREDAGKGEKGEIGEKAEVTVSLRGDGREYASAVIAVLPGGWARYDAVLTASGTCGTGEFRVSCGQEKEVLFGFMSLMPGETFMGHGLRKDLAEKLRDINPAFLRFPGGCIVEGFTMETVWYFRNTVGPVWERPSHWLLWHYRTTNGLGFHEYLQLCEDLGIAPLYVCNCGMTCQGRGPPLL